jgi:hypothetical protein
LKTAGFKSDTVLCPYESKSERIKIILNKDSRKWMEWEEDTGRAM